MNHFIHPCRKQQTESSTVRGDKRRSCEIQIFLRSLSFSSPRSPNEYEDLDKELEDLNARVSNDQGLSDLFAADDKSEFVEPLGDLNIAPLLDQDIPPLQLQLDPQEEPAASQMPASQIPAAAIKV